ncbi:hypothetical protein [Falsibacillus albus]|uniref:Uncharacterized protein n=1 Tax=Falsibacillus albus TaxID=2478915 RepID=A0A3L7JYY2_9BACI|nr:hypothetical protein [Falsibacillus albus]RLQ93582.1 hypothetical protein D9X91_16485 [Falsibacillus albus]
MEKQIIGMLVELQTKMDEFGNKLSETQADVKKLSHDLSNTQKDVKHIKQTVNRIEASQTDDVIAMLKVSKQNAETDFHYLNTRITNIDKRVFNLENRAGS